MVLTHPGGIAAVGGPPAARPPACLGTGSRWRGDRGSQTLELALLLPVLAMLLALVLQGGLAASELVLAQAVARDAARVASVDDDVAARAAAQAVAGTRQLDLRIRPAAGDRRGGELVTVEVGLRSAVLDRMGLEVWLPATASMRIEGR